MHLIIGMILSRRILLVIPPTSYGLHIGEHAANFVTGNVKGISFLVLAIISEKTLLTSKLIEAAQRIYKFSFVIYTCFRKENLNPYCYIIETILCYIFSNKYPAKYIKILMYSFVSCLAATMHCDAILTDLKNKLDY